MFASASQRGTILPLAEADKGLVDFCLDYFISDQLSLFQRKTVPDLKRIQEIAVDIVFFFNPVMVKNVTISLVMSCIWTMPFASQLDHIYGLFEIVMYLFPK